MIILIVMFIIAIIVIALLFYFTHVAFKEKETFVDVDYTLKKADDDQMEKYGLERCKVLNLQPNQTSAKDYIMVQEFIQGNRIKEWKPIKNRETENSAYCYFYDDLENGMQDNMMANCNCDISKPIFADNPMFDNIFHDVDQDNTHLHPIKKCVMKFNRSNITSENISKFLGALNDEYCTSLAMNMSLELSDVQKQYNDLLKLNSSLEYNYAFLKDKYDEEYNSLLVCASNNKNALNMIDMFTNSNDYYLKQNPLKKKEHDVCLEELSEMWANTSNNIIELRKDTENYIKNKEEEYKKLEQCMKISSDIENDMNRFINSTGILFDLNEKMYTENSNLYIANEQCKKDIKNVNESISEYTNKYNICFPNIEDYNICYPLLQTCKESLLECDKEQKMYNEKYNENLLNTDICQSNLKEVNKNLDKCSLENVILEETNKERGKMINNQNIIISDLIVKNNDCSSHLKTRIALKEELERRNEELRNQKAKLIIECSKVERNDEKSSIELAKKRLEIRAREIVKNTPNNCGYSVAF